MNDENGQKNTQNSRLGKECAYLAVFVALVLAAQLCFAAVAGVELVTVLFVVYAYVFGWKRGMLAATAFSLLRQLIFGFFPQILVLYMVYYNLLTLLFGLLGGRGKNVGRSLWWIVLVACACTVVFNLLDVGLNVLWYGYTLGAAKVYAAASLPVLLTQTVCTAVTVALLFLPLEKAFSLAKKGLL